MANGSQPLSKFQPDGRASILNYNLPDSTSYGGQGYIDLAIDPDWFVSTGGRGRTLPEWVGERYDVDVGSVSDVEVEHNRHLERAKRLKRQLEDRLARDSVEGAAGVPVISPDEPRERAALADAARLRETGRTVDGGARATMQGAATPRVRTMMLPLAEGAPAEGGAQSGAAEGFVGSTSDLLADAALVEALQPERLAADLMNGRLPMIYTGFSERPHYEAVPAPGEAEPRLMLVEEYRVSTYLGDYGAGRTLKTFSLLPGEETTISIKTYRATEEQRKQSESVLESKTESAAESFESEVGREQWDKDEYTKSKSYTKKRNWQAEGKASAKINLGIVKADVGGGGGGGGSSTRTTSSQRARTSFAKTTRNATRESSSKASSKREIEVNTSQKTTEETRFERTIERKLENINLSRTLNFVFRQLNQEFITVFHLVDVRVAFSDGTVATDATGMRAEGIHYREVPLWKLDDLLEEAIVEERRDDVRELIRRELGSIVGHDGEPHSMVAEEEIPVPGGETARYLRVDGDKVDEYTDPRVNPEVEPDQQPLRVPGVILDVSRNAMRTDAVIVEALLGKGEALDAYSQGLQQADVRDRQIENDRDAAQIERERLAREIVRNGDDAQVERFSRIFGSQSGRGVDVDINAFSGDREGGESGEE